MRELLELRPRTKVEFWTDRKYYKNVVKITTEIGVGWGGDGHWLGQKFPVLTRVPRQQERVSQSTGKRG